MDREALPTPSGWFCLGVADDFEKGKVVTRHLGGRELVVFRTTHGELAALDAHCPHLGAHMGKGGRVEGDTIRCPFHGFCFDAKGQCVKTGYGTEPPVRARARAYPVMELHGIALAYCDPSSLEPTWRPETVDMDGWLPFRFHQWTLRGHPQETTENAVDIGHFGVVHGYTNVREHAPTTIDGAHLRAQYGFDRPMLRLMGKKLVVREAIDVQVWGLGYSRVHVTDLSWGLDLRLLVLPTPISADQIDLRIGLSTRRYAPSLLTRPLARALLRVYRHEIEQDFVIWQNKRYVELPPLAMGDGPIGLYRQWVRQFYGSESRPD